VGFVIFRCTYSSQEKWDKFLTLAKQEFHHYSVEDVYDKLAWTIIEDTETLDGATILDTSRNFREWVENVGREELQGSVFKDPWYAAPRYSYFIYIDEESLQSVVVAEKAREPNGYFCKVVREDSVMLREEERQAGRIPDDLDLEDEDELRDLRKRVKLDDIVDVYTALLDNETWWNMYVDVETKVVDGIPGPGYI
jgi:hypothetical protein